MNISDIYKKYQIMPQLQEHQFRVAAVAMLISGDINRGITPDIQQSRTDAEVNIDDVVKACLLHDMGNIIKFDLVVTDRLHPNRFSKDDLAYWQKVKNDYIAKYGNDEHHASIEISREIGVNERIIGLIDCIGFQNGKSNAESSDFGKKICAYSDMRVGPKGIISLEERFTDLRKRYDAKHKLMGGNENLRLEFEEGLRQIEKQIFQKYKIKPEEITEKEIKEKLEELKGFEI